MYLVFSAPQFTKTYECKQKHFNFNSVTQIQTISTNKSSDQSSGSRSRPTLRDFRARCSFLPAINPPVLFDTLKKKTEQESYRCGFVLIRSDTDLTVTEKNKARKEVARWCLRLA